jgi:hypothetical protein
MPNLFRHPTSRSSMHVGNLSCEVLKQVQDDRRIKASPFNRSVKGACFLIEDKIKLI